MNEQLKQALAAVMNKTMAGVEAGASFLQAELPEVIQQLLWWKLAQGIFIALMAGAFAFAYYRFVMAIFKAARETFLKDSYGEQEVLAIVGFIVGGVLCFFALFIFAKSALTVLQILIAPKVYLIEYAASLAK